MWIRDLLNDRKWHRGDLEKLVLLVRHRGAEDDVRVVLGHEIRDIQPNGLLVDASLSLDDEEALADGAVFLPYHRVLRVTAEDGAVLWDRERHPLSEDEGKTS